MGSCWRRIGCVLAGAVLLAGCGTSRGDASDGQKPGASTTTTSSPPVGSGLIAFEQGVFDEDVHLAFYDPATEEVTPVPGGAFGYHARFSADGSKLIWSRMEDARKATDGVMVHDLRTGETRKVADEGGCPAFAPDGRSVVSGSRRIDLDSEQQDPLPGPEGGCRIELEPGRFLLTQRDATIDLVEGDEVEPIYEAPGCALDTASVSPDGERVAFVAECMDEVRVMVMGIDGSNPEPVATGSAYGTGWSPDGRSIVTAFLSEEGKPRSLWIIDTEGGLEEVLPGPINTPTWGSTSTG